MGGAYSDRESARIREGCPRESRAARRTAPTRRGFDPRPLRRSSRLSWITGACASISSRSSRRWSGRRLRTSIVARARAEGIVEITVHDLRAWTEDRHRSVDDAPYGGGAGHGDAAGALLPLRRAAARGGRAAGARGAAVTARAAAEPRSGARTSQRGIGSFSFVAATRDSTSACVSIWRMTRFPSGTTCWEAASCPRWSWWKPLCGCCRERSALSPSLDEESHTGGLLEYPQYTRPQEFRGWSVPEVLLSGDHAAIARWRRAERLRRTAARRPDLLERANLAEEDRAVFE